MNAIYSIRVMMNGTVMGSNSTGKTATYMTKKNPQIHWRKGTSRSTIRRSQSTKVKFPLLKKRFRSRKRKRIGSSTASMPTRYWLNLLSKMKICRAFGNETTLPMAWSGFIGVIKLNWEAHNARYRCTTFSKLILTRCLNSELTVTTSRKWKKQTQSVN